MSLVGSFTNLVPQYLYENHKIIREKRIFALEDITPDIIAGFEELLNASQPTNEDDLKSRTMIQYLHRKNPSNFCTFLRKSRLSHFILWTDAKSIIRHFNLTGLIYVKWENNCYKCSTHRNAGSYRR